MPAQSKSQQRFMGIVRGIQKGSSKGSKVAKDVAKNKLTAVFVVNPSPINMFVQKAKENIPVAKPNNLPGHNVPSNAINPYLVASM